MGALPRVILETLPISVYTEGNPPTPDTQRQRPMHGHEPSAAKPIVVRTHTVVSDGANV